MLGCVFENIPENIFKYLVVIMNTREREEEEEKEEEEEEEEEGGSWVSEWGQNKRFKKKKRWEWESCGVVLGGLWSGECGPK